MKRTLGLDLGTNSIGWAIIEQEDGAKKLAAAGSVIFSEGVARKEGKEIPSVSKRTSKRRTRRLYMRRRMRKLRILGRLIRNGMCPLGEAARTVWEEKGLYPKEDAFTEWLILNPYELRAKGLEEKLSSHELGRVLYHIAQRRGFRSNRKGGDGEQRTLHAGDPKKGITGYDETKELIEKYGTLGKAGAELAKTHTPIRNRYVMRVDLIDEFNQLWEVQKNFHPILTDALKAELGDGKNGDLFFQRPLKGKKADVGRCTLESGKKRAPLSSPIVEVFNVLHAVNNIKLNGEPLSEKGRNAVLPLFFRKSAGTFPIDDVRKALKKAKIEGELNYEKWEVRAAKEGKEVKLTGAKTIAHLADLWNEDPLNILRAYGIMRAEDAGERQKWDDRWNIIHREQNAWGEISERKEKGQYVRRSESLHEQRDLKEYAGETGVWKFNAEKIEALKKFDPKDGYHNLSARAIGRILPYLYDGIPYHYAVLYANLPAVFKVVHKKCDANGQPVLDVHGDFITEMRTGANGKAEPMVDDRWSLMTAEQREAIKAGIRQEVEGQQQYSVKTLLHNGLIRNYLDEFGDEGRRENFWNSSWEVRLAKAIQEAFTRGQKEAVGEAGLRDLARQIKARFIHAIESHDRVGFEKVQSMEERIKLWLIDTYPEYELGKAIDKRGLKRRVDQLYHHSAISTYRERDDRLGSPVTRGMKNPMVYRALHTLRRLVNQMIEEKLIDKKTAVHIEMARQLDSANKRRAWEKYQAEMRTYNEEAEKEARAYFESHGNTNDPTEDEITRMWLYQEARHLFGEAKCVYTGKPIGVADLFNGGVEIEHTWPRSKTADNSMANKMLCDTTYNRDVKKGQLPSGLPNYNHPARAAGRDCPALVESTKPIYAKWKKYERDVNALRNKSKAATTKEQKDRAIQDRWYAQFFRDYWRTKYEHLTAEEIKPRFLNRQLVATAQITKLARSYMNSYFDKVVCYKPEALSAFRKEWMGESFVREKDRSKHSHHAVDAAVCAAVDHTAFNALAAYYEVHDSTDPTASFAHPWETFGSEMHALRDGALIYHVDKASIGRRSSFKREIKLKNGRVIKWDVGRATGGTVRGSLHEDTYYGRVKRKNAETKEYELQTVIRKSLLGVTQFPFLEEDKANVVDPEIKALLAEADLEAIKVNGGLDMKTKNGDGFTMQKMKKVRVMIKGRVKNPVGIKAHRDRLPGFEHKHQLWVTGGGNPIAAVYADERGRPYGYVFSQLELAQFAKDAKRTTRASLAQLIPKTHPAHPEWPVMLLDNRPFIVHAGQKVVMYKSGPEEIERNDHEDMNRRTYVIDELQIKGNSFRLLMTNVLDARKPEDIPKETESVWDPNSPLRRLRFVLSKLKAQFDGMDIDLSPLPPSR